MTSASPSATTATDEISSAPVPSSIPNTASGVTSPAISGMNTVNIRCSAKPRFSVSKVLSVPSRYAASPGVARRGSALRKAKTQASVSMRISTCLARLGPRARWYSVATPNAPRNVMIVGRNATISSVPKTIASQPHQVPHRERGSSSRRFSAS